MNEQLSEIDMSMIQYIVSLGGSVEYTEDYFDINLGSLAISADILRPLSNLKRPFTLSLLESRYLDSDMRELLDLKHLTGLILTFSSVTDVGVDELASHITLDTLDLSGNRITNASLISLVKMQSLTCLNLCATKITDEGIGALRTYPKLAHLGLAQTAISDAAIPLLCQLTSLLTLNLQDTKVSDVGVTSLNLALPQCSIHR